MTLIAFFYGNNVPCPSAVQLYHSCNNTSNGRATDLFYETYIWIRSSYARHLDIYYNTRIKKIAYINFIVENPSEIVNLRTDNVLLGFETLDETYIKEKLELIQAMPYY
jgi:hypothetical protein